jgi:hypothetical protein
LGNSYLHRERRCDSKTIERRLHQQYAFRPREPNHRLDTKRTEKTVISQHTETALRVSRNGNPLLGGLCDLIPISGPCERAGVLRIEGAQCRLDGVTEASDALFDGRAE